MTPTADVAVGGESTLLQSFPKTIRKVEEYKN